MSSPHLPAFYIPMHCDALDRVMPPSYGLTKLELFAAMAMQGLCANPAHAERSISFIVEASANIAANQLAELEKGK